MEFAKAGPSEVGKYLNFLLAFTKSPSVALRPYARGNGTPATISGELFWFCAYSVGCGVLVFVAGDAIGMAPDTSASTALFRRIDAKVLPPLVALATLVFATVWHMLTRAVSAVTGLIDPELRFEGALEDSLNASLAVGTLFIVLLSLAFAGIRVAGGRTEVRLVEFYVSLGLGAAFLVYFVLAFAAAHCVSPVRVLPGSCLHALPAKVDPALSCYRR